MDGLNASPMRMALWFLLPGLGVALTNRSLAQEQRCDPDFDTRVNNPAYTEKGPRVLFDEAHHNFHTVNGRYKPFADLIRSDGYLVTPSREEFIPGLLSKFDILVIANALGAERLGAREAANSAFAEEECDAVRDWVQAGGCLLLITDHYPTGHAAEDLARRFGVQMSKGMTDEYLFTSERGLPAAHPIVRGRSAAEQVHRVRTFTGQSLKGPAESTSLLVLPEGAEEMRPDPVDHYDRTKASKGPAVHPSQGVALTFGRGRVVVLGEAAMLSAQLAGERRFGMNAPDIDNRQLALNIMHWLSRLLPER